MIGNILRWIFTYLFYPLVIIITFLLTAGLALVTVSIADETSGKIRRATGALLPIILLVFFVAMGQGSLGALEGFLTALDPTLRAILGAATGIILMELGKWLLKSNRDGAASLYALFLSTIVSFLIWALIGGILPVLNNWLLGLVLGSGIHIIFRGPPGDWWD